jgi:hypothetical protein
MLAASRHRRLILSRALLLPLLAALPLVAAPAAADSQQSFVDWYVGSLSGQNDTTALRREEKAIVKSKHARSFIRQLEQITGPLSPRDAASTGSVNLTSTQYLNTGKLLPSLLGLGAIPEGSISPKIRVRKYLTRDASGKVRTSAITDGVSALELKMPHPSRAGVSLKPRLFINDRHLKLILNGKRFAEPATRSAVVATLKADARNDGQTVDRLVQLFGQLHQRSRDKKLSPWVSTSYQRTAYLIPLKAGSNIQVTVDAEVRYKDPRRGKTVKKMKRSWRAVEVKIPDAYAAMSDRELHANGLGLVAQVRQLKRNVLEANQLPRFGVNKGKCSAFSRLAPKRSRQLRSRARWRMPR